MPTFHLLIKGKVQGVFYRATAKEKAQQLRLTGWVKNTPAGHVEAVIAGEQEDVDAFIEWCKKGPSRAEVEQVIVKPAPDANFSNFQVLR